MKVTLHAYWTQYEWERKPHLSFHDSEQSTNGGKNIPSRHLAGKFNLDLDIKPASHEDMVGGLVANLKAQQTDLRHQVFQLDQKIAELLCIENKEAA